MVSSFVDLFYRELFAFFTLTMEQTPWSIAEAAVRKSLVGNDASHDWAHVDRVVRNARTIARLEGITDPAELSIVELGALLHDIADHKYSTASAIDEADKVLREAVGGICILERPARPKNVALCPNDA